MLRVADVSFRYTARAGGNDAIGRESFSLHDVTIEVPARSLTGLLGPNGCGKTTLLKLASGVLTPERGAVMVDGRLLGSMSRRELAKRVAVVPQETHPAFDYTAMEMVLMGRHPHLGLFELEGPDDVAIARASLEATGTIDLANRPYMTLSGGEKQRVVIAAALAQAPNLLLLDEPTASLDLRYQLEVATLLAGLNHERGVTMVLATHDLNLAATLCDRLVLMQRGQVLAAGATNEVLNPANIRQLYDVEADVRFHQEAGHLTVVPVRRLS